MMTRSSLAVMIAVLAACDSAVGPGSESVAPRAAVRPPALPAIPAPSADALAAAASVTPSPEGGYTELACRYVCTLSSLGAGPAPAPSEWFLWRERSVVETRESRGGTGEIWRRDARGVIASLERVFHGERRVIEYTSGDLAAVNTQADWDRLNTVVDARRLGTVLRRTGESTVLGRATTEYQGVLDGTETSVSWFADLRLAARVRQVRPDHVVDLTLVDMRPIGAAPWERHDVGRFERTDFADIGDKHDDPFLRSLDSHAGDDHRVR